MTKYAKIVSNVAELVSKDPYNSFHPEVAKYFVKVPDKVEHKWIYNPETDEWAAPTPKPPKPQPEPEKTSKIVSPVEFLLLLYPEERISIRALRETDPIIDDFLMIVENPMLTEVNLDLSTTQQGVEYVLNKLVEANTIIEEEKSTRKDQILSGTFV